MEITMNVNKIIVIGSIILIISLISFPTIYKVIKNHKDNLNQVVYKNVIESAKKCYYEEVCTNNTITLKELYKNNYLEKVSNPVTKEYYNESSYVRVIDDDYFEFIVVE